MDTYDDLLKAYKDTIITKDMILVQQTDLIVHLTSEINQLRKALLEISNYIPRAEWYYISDETKSTIKETE